MEASIETFAARLRQPWLTCEASGFAITETFHRLVDTLQSLPQETFFVIAANQPQVTLAAVLAAIATRHPTVLGNPQWTQDEAKVAQNTLGGEQLWLGTAHSSPSLALSHKNGTHHVRPSTAHSTPSLVQNHKESEPLTLLKCEHSAPCSAAALRGYLLVPTGGTGGHLKLAYHNWQTLSAAIEGYAQFWQTKSIHAVCALPVFHIGGLMPALRTFATGGRLCLLPWSSLRELALDKTATDTDNAQSKQDYGLPQLGAIAKPWQISLVPAQVQQLLTSPAAVQWLRTLQAVLIGGAASNTALLQAAAALRIPLSPSYGMTETAATIALQRPETFLRIYQKPTPEPIPEGELLPHLSASIEAASGRILLRGSSLLHGYFPDTPQPPHIYATGDRGQLRGAHPQRLSVLGRLDRIINSGGKKIDPALVEQCIREQAHELGITLGAVLATGVADKKWGERLVAFIEMEAATTAPATALCERIAGKLPPFQVPKQWIIVSALPLDERGKPDHTRIAQLAEQHRTVS